MRAIQISAFGKPPEVLTLIDAPEPKAPGPTEALLQVEFAPINANDLYLIAGAFHYLPSLPSIVGNEGVGRVLAIGAEVKNVKPGDRVLLPLYSNSWRERITVPGLKLVPLPAEADVKQLAMLRINPPAGALLLSEYVDLEPGSWVIQNAANSGVGRAVIAFAKLRGLRTINLVRRAEVIPELKTAGGDLVLVDDENAASSIAEAVGKDGIRLALDGVGGDATARLAATLAPGGHLAAYAYMDNYVATVNLRSLMEKEIHLHAFYQVRPEYDAKIPGILADATKMIAAGTLHAPIAAVYPLSAIKEAAAHAERGGKVLLDMEKA